ncbi:TIGR03086 family metal-binding protein [Actinophytocola gossypii]|uniref:TIGR03086 family protein n=1 Tax=Actinophytocola gossypii TaxID=2812003 RepID=A0ABT2J228_9PSEU|nr:TIGR03086 family metal-binding protein [Actinophytocola gossypii]MCT2581909.1 TIGR03086 family protein [Actinophytocola gossypii]
MELLEQYRLAQDGFDAVVAAVPADRWDAPSACAEWTVRDVVGHVVWGQRQMRAWATESPDPERTGAPGSPRPGVLAGTDPVGTWRAARAESVPALTPAALARVTSITGIGEVPLAAVVTLLLTDTVAHTWDVGHAVGARVELDPVLVAVAFDWARAHVVRRPGFFGPERTPPEDADEQTRMLAYLGRASWEPVPA